LQPLCHGGPVFPLARFAAGGSHTTHAANIGIGGAILIYHVVGPPSQTLRIFPLLLSNSKISSPNLSLICSAVLLHSCSIPNAIGEAISKGTSSIFPLRDCMIRKVKMLKKPKFDIVKLMEMHETSGEDAGKGMGRDEPIVATLKGSGGRL